MMISRCNKFVKSSTGPGRQSRTSANNERKYEGNIYKGKKVKVPFEDAKYSLDGDKDIEIQNPFSGEKATVPGYAAAVYDYTVYLNHMAEKKDAETGEKPGFSDNQNEWQKVRNGLDWFRQYFAKEYMVLLD